MIVYLAGPMTGCGPLEMSLWRHDARRRLESAGFIVLCPLRDGGDKLRNQRAEYYRDEHDVKRCDIVLANLALTLQVSIGTISELQMAHDHGKYAVSVLDDRHDHLFTRENTCYRAANLDEAINHIISSFGGL